MKKILTLIIVFVFVQISFGQTLLLEEDFNYTAGANLTDNTWTAHSSASTNPITVNSSGLTYAGYNNSGIGNSALLDNTGEDVHKTFSSQSSGVIYYSFLLNVSNISAGYFIYLSKTASSGFAARVFIKTTSGGFLVGISNTSTATYGSTVFSKNTTYLCIVEYNFSTTAVSIWVKSSGVPATKTDAGTAEASTSGSGQTSLFAVGLRQYFSTQNIIVDGIRISDDWSQAPLPVELTSFTANVLDNSVVLEWQTATEVNNYGFEIQRAGNLRGQGTQIANSDLEGYTAIGFVNGNGNSNSPKFYSFTDNSVTAGKISYRLKQIDTDGQFEYSDIVKVTISSPNKFELLQNYPNPFNPTTQITFKLPIAAKINLSVFNVLGEKVYELENGFLEAGVHSINFNAKGLASGVYFYRLSSSDIVLINKMMLLK